MDIDETVGAQTPTVETVEAGVLLVVSLGAFLAVSFYIGVFVCAVLKMKTAIYG